MVSAYGIKGGVALSHLTERRTYQTDNIATDNRLGLVMGMFGEFLRTEYFGITLEVNFEQKGDNLGGNYSTLNVLSIPVLAKFSLPNRLPGFYISAGPRGDFLLSKKDGSTTEGFYSNINPVNYGITVSVGGEIRMSKKYLIILEAAYSPDFTTSNGQYGNILENKIIYRSISFEFRTGLKFNH